MADILIRGIEYPQCCGECPFQASRWAGDFCSAGQFMLGIDFDYRDKHTKCPIVPLPEGHGELIDKAEAYDRIAEQEGGNYIDMDSVGMGLEECRTIVPAEGGGWKNGKQYLL